ncbi:MAG: FAD-binding oxidoreductase [SAR202 cluster bacterium]|nr:FAD-binding oxidoreductase [SAR202 cluster bacterium]
MRQVSTLPSSNETDVLIIGGGIAGTASVFHLAQHDNLVILLERGEIAGEASGVNVGGLGGLGGLGWGHNPTCSRNTRRAG